MISEALAAHRAGDLLAAERGYLQVIADFRMQGQPHRFLGLIYFQQRKYSESLPFLVRACLLSPLDTWAHYSLGTSYVWCLEPEKAIESFDHCLRLDPEFHRARFARTMANIPMVYHSQPEIELWRGRYSDSFQELVLHYTHASAEHRSAAAEVIGVNQPYFLPYQASDDRKLQEALGGLSCMLMSARYPQFSGELEMPSVSDHERLRIGFLSAFFKEHSNWKMPLRGWIENSNRTSALSRLAFGGVSVERLSQSLWKRLGQSFYSESCDPQFLIWTEH